MNNNKQQEKRTVRIFVSSTFRDMIEDRNALMTHCWPELRRFCKERHVELVEVDLRWGIAEEQSTRNETLKLCLDEIHACRPFFIGLLGERYGWVPNKDAFTRDLIQEQSWLENTHNKSVTELEIIHGVLKETKMDGRAFFYFRDPKYIDTIPKDKRADFLSDNKAADDQQTRLKNEIRVLCKAKNIPLLETYPNPQSLAPIVLKQLKDAIDKQFPLEDIPDSITHEAMEHEAFAEARRRTYIGRQDYFTRIDHQMQKNGKPLLILGDSGSGKSSLIANWVDHWRNTHAKDFIFQHYIGGTSDSADHWKIMKRLISEIKKWSGDPDELPKTNEDTLRDFTVWLAKARQKANRNGIKFIIILDALNQMEDKDHARNLGWLSSEPFRDNLKLIISTLPDDTLEAIKKRELEIIQVEPLTPKEKGEVTEKYLKRFGKKLDGKYVERLAKSNTTSNPLYLKIILDELRVTGTFDNLDMRLTDYLSTKDTPALLQKILLRYQKDYEKDRKGLVSEALGLIWASRRGLTETELLQLLKPDNLPQLPLAIWSPLRAALEDSLIDRGGILNFSHDFLRSAVEKAFVFDVDKKDDFRIQLADYFEQLPIDSRICDELPWLLMQTESFERLRNCLLNIDYFIQILKINQGELQSYWVSLNEEKNMGTLYVESFYNWKTDKQNTVVAYCAHSLGFFLSSAALYVNAEPLLRLALHIEEERCGKGNPNIGSCYSNLAEMLLKTFRLVEAEEMLRKALKIAEDSFGVNHPNVAIILNQLEQVVKSTNRLQEAESLINRSININELCFGKEHPRVALDINNLALIYQETNRIFEAEQLLMKAITIDERYLGENHPNVARDLGNLAQLFWLNNRLNEAEKIIKRALLIDEYNFGHYHPNVANRINTFAGILYSEKRYKEAEQLFNKSLSIVEESLGKNHPHVAYVLNNLAQLYQETNRLIEAEELMERVLRIDINSLGENHPNVARDIGNIAVLYAKTKQNDKAVNFLFRALKIELGNNGVTDPKFKNIFLNSCALLTELGWSMEDIVKQMTKMGLNLSQIIQLFI